MDATDGSDFIDVTLVAVEGTDNNTRHGSFSSVGSLPDLYRRVFRCIELVHSDEFCDLIESFMVL